eukprot:859836-Pyramimonas_sp.AAC.1
MCEGACRGGTNTFHMHVGVLVCVHNHLVSIGSHGSLRVFKMPKCVGESTRVVTRPAVLCAEYQEVESILELLAPVKHNNAGRRVAETLPLVVEKEEEANAKKQEGKDESKPSGTDKPKK